MPTRPTVNGTRTLAILAVLTIALAVVLYFMQDPATERIVMLLSFLGGITAALLQIARNQQQLNGEIKELQRTVSKAERVAPAVTAAATRVEEAVPAVHEAADRVEHAAEHLHEEAVPAVHEAADRVEHAAEHLHEEQERSNEPGASA